MSTGHRVNSFLTGTLGILVCIFGSTLAQGQEPAPPAAPETPPAVAPSAPAAPAVPAAPDTSAPPAASPPAPAAPEAPVAPALPAETPPAPPAPAAPAAPAAPKQDYPPRLRRSDSFLGIHFDFHAGDNDKKIGENVSEDMVNRIIDKVHPDYIQIDCKGHPGRSSYPTKAGNPAGGFVQDPLRIWRDATAKRGVALYMHYSGVFDQKAIELHPDWALVNADGKVNTDDTSVFGPYVDELLIPQLKELRGVYGVDGVWIDGECWATGHDYSERAIKLFQEKTGITDVPRKPEDPHYFEFTQFCREGFRNYLRHYVDELHKFDPSFQIASNWAFSSLMPEPVTANIDFISGDYSPQNSIHAARYEARCMRFQGKPWDLMAWSFRHDSKFGATTKSALQLQQEAAAVLALGGGFQAYFPQKRDASVIDWQMNIMSEVAKFCRARQALCHRAEPIPQVALLYSTAATYQDTRRLFNFGKVKDRVKDTLNALLDSQLSVDIVMEHHLAGGKMASYPLIIIPEWSTLQEDFKKNLVEYVRNGGRLLLIGPESALMFTEYLGVTAPQPAASKTVYLERNNFLGQLKDTLFLPVEAGAASEPFGAIYLQNEPVGQAYPAATICPLGQGRFAAVYVNLSESFGLTYSSHVRDFLGDLARKLYTPMVQVQGSHFVDVVLNQKDGKLLINLFNTAGPHSDKDVWVFDEIPPVGPLTVNIRMEKKPQQIRLEPAGQILNFQYRDDAKCVDLIVPRLEIHEILVVE